MWAFGGRGIGAALLPGLRTSVQVTGTHVRVVRRVTLLRLGSPVCPTGASYWCKQLEVISSSSADANAACARCAGAPCNDDSVCDDSNAWVTPPVSPPGACSPASAVIGFVYGSAMCSAGNTVDENNCWGGFTERWEAPYP